MQRESYCNHSRKLMTNLPPSPHISVPCGPLTFEFLGHTSVSAYDLEAGYPGACLEAALRAAVNAYTIPRFDKQFSEWLFEFTGVPRGINEKQTTIAQQRGRAHEKPILESFPKYLTRVMSRVSPEMQLTIREEALAQSRLFKISSAPAVRTAPIEPKFLKRAQALLSQELAQIDLQVSEMLAVIGTFPVTRDSDSKPELESLARLMQQFSNHLLSQDD